MTSWADWNRCPPGTALRAGDAEIASLIEEEITRQNDGLAAHEQVCRGTAGEAVLRRL
jgi:hypothetical protein